MEVVAAVKAQVDVRAVDLVWQQPEELAILLKTGHRGTCGRSSYGGK